MQIKTPWRRLSRREIHRRIKHRLERMLQRRWPGTQSAFRRALRHLLRRRTRVQLVRIARLSTSAALFLILHSAAQLSAAHADPIDLSDIQTDADARGFIIRGDTDADDAGFSVSTAGDVNGDGLADLVVGAKHADANGAFSGTAFVVFGKSGGEAVELSEIPSGADPGGFAIYGVGERHYTGYSVSGAGDVNGDGLDDLVIGASKADAGGTDRGAAYVVFGKKSGASLQLSDVEQSGNGDGFAIYGIADFDRVGWSVSGAGDVNGDGLADVIVGARGASPNELGSGASYVVFGKTGGASVNLSDVEMDGNDSGFGIWGAEKNDAAYIVSGAGDVNADGLADVVIGARGHNFLAGKTYVVFGKPGGASVDLGEVEDDLDTRGFVVYGIEDGDNSGGAVSGAGDVNGDGLADIITGATDANFYAGESYVVFGKPDGAAVQLSDLVLNENGSGFVMTGATGDDDESGTSVSGIGDANGDGYSDVIIGVPFRDGPTTNVGGAYVVYGKPDGAEVPLVLIETGQDEENLMIRGILFNDYAGRSVADAGDVNGDGLPDLIIGASSAKDAYSDPYDFSGAAYVVFSQAVPDATSMYFAYSRPGDGDGGAIVPETPLPDARMTIDFSDNDHGDDGSGGASLETAVLHRSSNSISNLVTAGLTTAVADVAWKFTTDRVGWNGALITLKYTNSEIAPFLDSQTELAVFTAPGLSGPWVEVGSALRPQRNEVAVPIGPAQNPRFFAIGLGTEVLWVNFGYSGTEIGTRSLPFDTLQEAVNAVKNGGTLKIDGDSGVTDSPATPTISKPVTIEAVDGTITIGAP